MKRVLAKCWPVNRYIWYRLPPSEGYVVALTFHAGPVPVSTPPVLDILGLHAANGVFFVLGNACLEYPELV